MSDTEKLELLNKNYDELEEGKKLDLILIGENLLNIQKIVNQETETNNKTEDILKI